MMIPVAGLLAANISHASFFFGPGLHGDKELYLVWVK